MAQALQNFVNGSYTDAADGRTSDVIDPTTGEVFAQAPISGEVDVDVAMQAAQTRHRRSVRWRCCASPTPSSDGPRN
jgi:acyl-CoA reductase-like NAD-dependent aldehyde dehydrogenase